MRITYAQARRIADEIEENIGDPRLLPLLPDEAERGHILLCFDRDDAPWTIVTIARSGTVIRRRNSLFMGGGVHESLGRLRRRDP